MIVYLIVLAAAVIVAALVGFLIGDQQAEPCACVSAGLPRPTYYGRHDGGIVVGERDEVLVRPVNGRNLGTQPRRTPHPSAADPVTPAATDDRPPWYITTTQQPAIDDAGLCDFHGGYGELGDCTPACPAHAFAFRPHGVPDAPVYGEACQLVVAAAQNPALRDQPVVPAYMSAPAGGAE